MNIDWSGIEIMLGLIGFIVLVVWLEFLYLHGKQLTPEQSKEIRRILEEADREGTD